MLFMAEEVRVNQEIYITHLTRPMQRNGRKRSRFPRYQGRVRIGGQAGLTGKVVCHIEKTWTETSSRVRVEGGAGPKPRLKRLALDSL